VAVCVRCWVVASSALHVPPALLLPCDTHLEELMPQLQPSLLRLPAVALSHHAALLLLLLLLLLAVCLDCHQSCTLSQLVQSSAHCHARASICGGKSCLQHWVPGACQGGPRT
jgi:hypothetical protein